MNKSELIDTLATRLAGDKKTAAAAVDGLIDVVSRAVSKGERVAITGFGVFEKRNRNARTARNPRTGDTIKVKKTSVPAFRPGQQFKDVVSGAKKLGKVATAPVARVTSAARGGTTTTARTAKSAPDNTAPGKSTAKAATKSATKAASAKSTGAKKTGAKKTTAKKTTAKKTTGKKTTAKGAKSTGSKSTASKAAGKKAASKSSAKSATKSAVKSATKKAPAKKASS